MDAGHRRRDEQAGHGLRPSPGGWALRWFTPRSELTLCGHATLASAHVLWEQHLVPEESVVAFDTCSGPLRAAREDGRVVLDFPADPAAMVADPSPVEQVLGGKRAVWVGRNRLDYLAELESESDVRTLAPDLAHLATLDVRGLCVTARADEGTDIDFVSRFFAPAVGIQEDFVTGSAHCALGPYWGNRLNRTEMNAYQASPRGGHLGIRLTADRVFLLGHAVTVASGYLAIGYPF
jgi:predicted PhzF superfamily epimerase YddE/YHI9